MLGIVYSDKTQKEFPASSKTGLIWNIFKNKKIPISTDFSHSIWEGYHVRIHERTKKNQDKVN